MPLNTYAASEPLTRLIVWAACVAMKDHCEAKAAKRLHELMGNANKNLTVW